MKTNTFNRSNQSGFTLIELVVVIVILGILAVTAAPKFIDLTSDAHSATLDGVSAAFTGAASMSKMKAIVAGEQNKKTSKSVTINGAIAELKYGYPAAYANVDGNLDIIDLIEVSEDLQVCYGRKCKGSNSPFVKVGFDTTENSGCYVKYTEPRGKETTYAIEKVTEGC